MKQNLVKLLFYIFRVFPIKNNKIVVTSYYGKGYGDSAKYICNYLIKNYNDKVQIVWLVKNVNDNNYLPDDIKAVKYKSILSIFELATAKVWIDNSRKPYYFLKRKKQFYIQLWHSSLRLKKIEKDAEQYLPLSYLKNAISDSKKVDLMISGCDFSFNTYRNSFWYDGPILKCGTPRCDIFFDQETKNQIKRKICDEYDINYENKLIIYSPTFRKNSLTSHKNINFEEIIKILNEKDDKNYTFLLRYHPNSNIEFNDTINVKNVSKYSDMQELICVSDIMITDYSGCCFDMALSNKPCILYVEDLNEYLSQERDLYFDFNDLPFSKAMDLNELVSIFKNFDFNDYNKRLEKFNDMVNFYEDGNASERVAKKIMEVIENGK